MLEAKGLGRDYGPVCAVASLDMELKPGTVTGLVGNNGAGKTTTLKMLTGILRPTRGTVRLDGRDPAEAPTRQHIGYLPEESPLYEDQTPVEYLRFFGGLYGLPRVRVRQQIPVLLDELRLDRPFWDRPIGQLSKGSQRKVAIARCLLHDPDLLVLDEPASGLDPATQDELDTALLRLRAAGKTILLSAHDLVQVERLCDDILILHEGRVRGHGSLEELRAVVGGTAYEVEGTVPFHSSHMSGAVHVASFSSMDAAEAAMAQIRGAGGTILAVRHRAPGLDEVLRRLGAPEAS